jgi:hypothetical protein
VSTFFDRTSRKSAGAVTTEWDDDGVVASGPTRCDEPITAGDAAICMEGINARGPEHPRSTIGRISDLALAVAGFCAVFDEPGVDGRSAERREDSCGPGTLRRITAES